MSVLVGVVRSLPHLETRWATAPASEEDDMTEPKESGGKTLGVKFSGPIHAQLSLICQLENMSLTDAIKLAVEQYIERKRTEGGLASRAAEAAAEIEQEAANRRAALEALFGTQPPQAEGEPAVEPDKPAGRTSRRRGDATS